MAPNGNERDGNTEWALSAVSSQVLLTGASTPEMWAISLAFKELVLRGNLRLGQERRRRWIVLHQEIDVLGLGRWPPAATERPLRGLMEAFPKADILVSSGGGVAIDVAGREVRRWYRLGGGYVQEEVLPELQRRGLYRLIQTERGPEWQLTEAGSSTLAELRALIATGTNDFPRWLHEDRDRAMAYLASAGVAVLLVGNPAWWLWELLARVLVGEQVPATSIPVLMGHPFTTPAEPLRPEQTSSSQRSEGTYRTEDHDDDERDAHGTEDQSAGDQMDDAAGGGGGGFESPGETIDAGMGGDGDGDGDGGVDGE